VSVAIKKIMYEVRNEIEEIRKAFEIKENDFAEVAKNNWQLIQKKFEYKFISKESPKAKYYWYWYALKGEQFSLFASEKEIEILNKLLNEDEKIYFFTKESGERAKFWLYEGKVKYIIKIINKACLIDEYYSTPQCQDQFI
jgi:hypothetical protein